MDQWAFDTEDNSNGGIYYINFYNGRNHYSFTSRDDAILFLAQTPGRFWACNLEYDLANIFGDQLSIVEWFFGRSKLIRARYKKAYFCDTLNHWKMSVKDMGEYLGLPKLPFDPQNLEYCRRDTEVTFKFVKKMVGLYERLGADCKSTIGSTAFHYWKKFSGVNLPYEQKNRERISTLSTDLLDRWRMSYYGGRTECFFIGKVAGQVHYVDINSMYPWAMRGALPWPYDYQEKIDLQADGLTDATVFSDMALPVLPYRNEVGRLLFPNGTLRGFWSNHELRYFKEQGGEIIKLHNGYTFNIPCDPFTAYIDDLYGRRRTARDPLEKLTLKLFMNNTYGKFGEGNERVVMELYEKFLTGKNKPDHFSCFGDLVLYNILVDYPYQTNFVWSGIITARARVYLHTLMKQIKDMGNELLYCDTDSVIFKGSLKGLEISDNLGGFKLEGTFNNYECRTAKQYKYDKLNGEELIRCKGVPSKSQADFFKNGEATYKKPLRIKEALRRDMRPNLWIEHKKVNVTEYNKGIITKSGYVKPHVIK